MPGAVAVGLFCGMIPGPVQMLAALICAIPCRSNIPLAMFVTWYTNPFTIVPIYLVAYEVGRWLLGYAEPQGSVAPPEWQWTLLGMWQWIASLGKPLGVGIVVLAVVLAPIGYVVTALGWRWRVLHPGGAAALNQRAARSAASVPNASTKILREAHTRSPFQNRRKTLAAGSASPYKRLPSPANVSNGSG